MLMRRKQSFTAEQRCYGDLFQNKKFLSGVWFLKISAKLENIIIRSLSQSMTVYLMERLAQRVYPDYNLHKRTGFPHNIPIPQITAAKQITRDMRQGNAFLRFVEVLIDVNKNGIMGKKISIRFLSQIINEVEQLNYKFDPEIGMFVEGSVKTKGWGILQEGKIYEFSFLRIDIVGNSNLVRKYPSNIIKKTYSEVKSIVKTIVEKRDGRIWNWEGDGGIAAFYLANKNLKAALCGVEILMELFMYNLLECKLNDEIRLRIAVHTGPSVFSESIDDIQNDTLRRLELIESKYTSPNSVTVSPGVFSDLGGKLEKFFTPIEISTGNYLYNCSLKWGEVEFGE